MTSFNVTFHGVSAAKLKKLIDCAESFGVSIFTCCEDRPKSIAQWVVEGGILSLVKYSKHGWKTEDIVLARSHNGIDEIHSALEVLVEKRRLWKIGDAYYFVNPPLL